MFGFILTIVLVALGFFVGQLDQAETFHTRCVSFYGDMPHNKVEAFCAALLKFEKDTK